MNGLVQKRTDWPAHTAQRGSIVVRAGQIIPALAADQFAALRLEPLRTHRAETDGLLFNLLRLGQGHAEPATIGVFLQAALHGPKVIA